MKQLRRKYAIHKRDTGNGVVLMKIDDYRHCMTDLFSEATKFQTHKSFDHLPPFPPITDTTGTAYQPVAKYITNV